MSENVNDRIRDEVMSNILAKPENQVCFDCGSKAPKWASPYLGIVICYECAAKHRSYGTHISFVRSCDLDKWNRKQLKSLELTGNSYTKLRFNDLGVPLIGGNYDYNNSMVLKVRQEIAEKVKENLKPDDYRNKEEKNKKNAIEFDDVFNEDDNKIKNNDEKEIKNKNDEKEEKKDKNEKTEKPEEEEEIQKPQKFKIEKKVNNVKIKSKASKKNKIKKVDFDYDFENFNNDVNFSDFNKTNDDKEEEKKDEDTIQKEEKEKEKEKESEEGYNKSYDTKVSKKKLNKKFANKKAISSEDYAALENEDTNNRETKERIKSMGNSQAISSEDVFGNSGGSNVYEGESMTDRLKEMALNFTLGAAERAKELKNKTNELINKVQNKFSGSGY